MKHLLTAIACCLAVAGSAQTEWPWNPDSNDDGNIHYADYVQLIEFFDSTYEVQDTCSFMTSATNFDSNNDSIIGTCDLIRFLAVWSTEYIVPCPE